LKITDAIGKIAWQGFCTPNDLAITPSVIDTRTIYLCGVSSKIAGTSYCMIDSTTSSGLNKIVIPNLSANETISMCLHPVVGGSNVNTTQGITAYIKPNGQPRIQLFSTTIPTSTCYPVTINCGDEICYDIFMCCTSNYVESSGSVCIEALNPTSIGSKNINIALPSSTIGMTYYCSETVPVDTVYINFVPKSCYVNGIECINCGCIVASPEIPVGKCVEVTVSGIFCGIYNTNCNICKATNAAGCIEIVRQSDNYQLGNIVGVFNSSTSENSDYITFYMCNGDTIKYKEVACVTTGTGTACVHGVIDGLIGNNGVNAIKGTNICQDIENINRPIQICLYDVTSSYEEVPDGCCTMRVYNNYAKICTNPSLSIGQSFKLMFLTFTCVESGGSMLENDVCSMACGVCGIYTNDSSSMLAAGEGTPETCAMRTNYEYYEYLVNPSNINSMNFQLSQTHYVESGASLVLNACVELTGISCAVCGEYAVDYSSYCLAQSVSYQ
jgi:hypothetical protein